MSIGRTGSYLKSGSLPNHCRVRSAEQADLFGFFM